ncbi:hypothetical protein ACS0TY_002509 [Phlomoides rotata]
MVLCLYFLGCAHDTCVCLFERNNISAMVLPSHSFLRPLPFSFLMTLLSHQFPTCFSIDIMFISDPLSGFCFVYMEDERDAEDAIRKLDRIDFGRKGRRLRVEWTKQQEHGHGGRKPDTSRKPAANTRPSRTLFVINFDPINTRSRDIEKYFEHYGKVSNVRIRKNFAFVQFELQEDATRALEATNLRSVSIEFIETSNIYFLVETWLMTWNFPAFLCSKFMDRVISVEYAIRDDDEKRNGHSPDRRGRDVSPDGRNYDRRRSPSPYQRDRGSPDYGHGSLPNSRSERRGSPHYGRAESPVNDRRYNSRSPPRHERS